MKDYGLIFVMGPFMGQLKWYLRLLNSLSQRESGEMHDKWMNTSISIRLSLIFVFSRQVSVTCHMKREPDNLRSDLFLITPSSIELSALWLSGKYLIPPLQR